MIWYDLPVAVSAVVFLLLLLASVLHIIAGLAAGEVIAEKKELNVYRLYQALLALFSLYFTLEMLLVIASIEGGIYLRTSYLYRHLVLFMPLFIFIMRSEKYKIDPCLRPLYACFFLPLLRLPQVDLLPAPLPVILAIFVAFWLFYSSIDTTWAQIKFKQTQITRDAMPQIIHRIRQGICVAGRNGWFLESNPAFKELCRHLGMETVENLDEFESQLNRLVVMGDLQVREMETGRSIRLNEETYFLQHSAFRQGRKEYIQLALSDVTKTSQTAMQLEYENNILREKNLALEKEIAAIEQKQLARDRERLCRKMHDLWSQHLAVAGLSLDLLLDKPDVPLDKNILDQVISQIDIILNNKTTGDECDLKTLLQNYATMYRQLGVLVKVQGQAEFSNDQQQALCAIVKEALANAVRHAYAREIEIKCFSESRMSGLVIKNRCLDKNSSLKEGRGIHDMKNRASEAGGDIRILKGSSFQLQVSFARK